MSKSMNVSASSVHRNPHAARPCHVGPKRQMAAAASAPPRISTSGYRAEMGVPQAEHLPRSASHDTTGTFSSAVMPCPQEGHLERGTTML